MKRYRYWMGTALLVTLLLTVSLAGCGTENHHAAKDKKESKNTTEVAAAKIQTEKQTDEKAKEPVNTASAKVSSSTTVSNHVATTTTNVQSNNNTKTTQTVKTSVKPAASTSTSTTAKNASTSTSNKSQVPSESVTLSITGPNDHRSILASTKVAYKKEDTVFSVLSREADLKNIYIGKKGSGPTLYIDGLEDKDGKWSIYEFDYGPKSGWIFKINGAELTKSVGATPVKAGDRIECIYIQ